MPYYPSLNMKANTVLNTRVFYGLNRGLSIADGEMADMLNMTGDHYPVLSTRAPRGEKKWLEHEDGGVHVFNGEIAGMLGTDRLILCHGGKVYVDGAEVGLTVSDEEHMKPKHMVSMGAYVCIWPDKKYINLANPDDYGDMGARWAANGTPISATMCRNDGTEYDMEAITVSDTAPEEPEDQQFWLDTSGENDVLKQYSAIYTEWVQVATTYIKIQATGIGKKFKENDVVFLAGVRQAGQDAMSPRGITEEILSFSLDDFMMHSTFQTTYYGGTDYRSTTATRPTVTKTLNVTGIPEGANVEKAVLKFFTKYSAYDALVLTMNGMPFKEGRDVELPVNVNGNGNVSLQFVFQSNNVASSSGNHVGTMSFSNVRLEVTYTANESSTETTEADKKQMEALNTSNIIYGRGDDHIIVAGLLHSALDLDEGFVAELKIPDLDYVCEANNRLWGCSYATLDGTLTNEIRACALGDFRNWYSFIGTSMDSYVMSVGSDGEFTGAYSLQGVPLFFKEDYLHKIAGTIPANFTLNTIRCRGVQEGSWRSLAVVNETLFYKARMDVMAYDGAMPYSVSEKLGSTRYWEAVGGAQRDKYYINMRDADVKWHMYVYDTAKGLWHKEDETSARHMANVDGDLIMAVSTTGGAELVTAGSGSGENAFPWSVTFGMFGYAYETSKYLSRFNIRAQMAAGSTMTMEIMYDSNGEWVDMGTMRCKTLQTFMLPVIPRRCDHCQVRLSGTGEIKLYSMARVFEQGGDG